jgi:organic radical activating enzyme
MSNDFKYPVSETFVAPQGETHWSGQLMFFLRLAGCCVGKPIKDEMHYSSRARYENDGLKESSKYGKIPIWQEECTLYDGRQFPCDTDFRVKERLTVDEILNRAPANIEHLCITGGEPLVHNLDPIIQAWLKKVEYPQYRIHIETSGTREISDYGDLVWITVSPKANYLDSMIAKANEIKFLVDENFDEKEAEKVCIKTSIYKSPDIWLSPINEIKDFIKKNGDKCQEIQKRYPNWRITCQLHKMLGCS